MNKENSQEQLSPQENAARRVNEIYSVYQSFFYSGFHTLLWHILFSKSTEGKTVTFYPVYEEGGLSLVLADNTGGYIQTPTIFIKSLYFEGACSICVLLSKEVFNQTPEEHQKIADQSFCKSPIRTESAKAAQ